MSELNHTQQKIDTYVMPVEANWAVSVRERALNWIVEHGLPNRKDEYWKYTDPKLLNSTKIPEINEIDSIENSLISLPLRYMHTTVEMVHKDDVENSIRMLLETVKSIKNGQDFRYLK